jgi:hypothetical protein
MPGQRALLFVEGELLAWEDGAELDVRKLPDGGRVVRPRT